MSPFNGQYEIRILLVALIFLNSLCIMTSFKLGQHWRWQHGQSSIRSRSVLVTSCSSTDTIDSEEQSIKSPFALCGASGRVDTISAIVKGKCETNLKEIEFQGAIFVSSFDVSLITTCFCIRKLGNIVTFFFFVALML
jgi:hypothetical protein